MDIARAEQWLWLCSASIAHVVGSPPFVAMDRNAFVFTVGAAEFTTPRGVANNRSQPRHRRSAPLIGFGVVPLVRLLGRHIPRGDEVGEVAGELSQHPLAALIIERLEGDFVHLSILYLSVGAVPRPHFYCTTAGGCCQVFTGA